MDIAQANNLTVEHIFTLSGTVIATCYGNLVLIVVKSSVCVVKAQSDLGKAERFSDLRAAEDNIFHF